MTILLTGVTGNLGAAVGTFFEKRGHRVIPIVRAKNEREALSRIQTLPYGPKETPEAVCADLEDPGGIAFRGHADAIVHCAGSVNFHAAGLSNTKGTKTLLRLSQALGGIPLYHVSTAYLYQKDGNQPRNSYENDKRQAEEILFDSQIPFTIVRPSILTGESVTGAFIHFTGYYLVVKSFIKTLRNSRHTISFPRLPGFTNIVPVDAAAESLVTLTEKNARGTFYLTNSSPPSFISLLDQTLLFFGLRDRLKFIESSFSEYERGERSDEERELLNKCHPFFPYWALEYPFPPSDISATTDERYIGKILSYFTEHESP